MTHFVTVSQGWLQRTNGTSVTIDTSITGFDPKWVLDPSFRPNLGLRLTSLPEDNVTLWTSAYQRAN